MPEAAAKKKRTQTSPAGEPHAKIDPESPATAAPEHVCTVGFCPICLLVSAMQPLKPDVVEHLLAAGREFFLAMKAVVDARSDDLAGEGEPDGERRARRLERIDIA